MYKDEKSGSFGMVTLPHGGRYLSLCQEGQESRSLGAMLALGCFDGFHPGHRSLLENAGRYAREKGIPFGVWSPAGAKKDGLLLPFEDKMAILQRLFVDFYIEDDFEAIKDLSGEAFFEEYLVGKYHAVAFACGENFTFGRGGRERAEDLCRYAERRGLFVHVEKMKSRGDTPYSSALVRSALTKGDPTLAARALGSPYGFSSTVIKGRQVGRGLGFPTANLCLPKDSPLKKGVYAAWVTVEGQDYPAIANVGVHPTFKAAKDPLCEAYLLKPPPFDLYGRRVAITFLAFLREERQFSCPEELTRQIGCDLKRAEEFFSQATDETGRPHGAF